MKRINKKKFLIMALILPLLFSVFAVIVVPTQAETQSRNSFSAAERIQADYKAKKITIDEYILYKAWAVFKPEKLSGTKYVLSSKDAKFRKDGTPIILEIKKNWSKLSSKTKDQLGWVFDRPTDIGGGAEGAQHILPQLTVSTGGNFMIHWTNGTDGGDAADAPDLTDVSPANGIPDYIDNIASTFDNVWDFEVTSRGFHAPPSDAAEPNDGHNRNPDGKYDVFIYDVTGAYGALGYSDPEQYPNSPSYSYIALDNDLEGDSYLAQQCPAHEFFHAIQFYYDCAEELWWMETTAQYMAFEAYPVPSPGYYNSWWFNYWFQFCDTYGLTTFNGWHEYGNFHWAKRLSEDSVVGDTIIKEIWEECQTTDGLTAIDNVLLTEGSGIDTEFKEFTKANFFLEDMYADGADYRAALTGHTTFDGVWLEYQYDAATDGLPFTIDSTNVNYDAWMDEWATDYITLTLDAGTANYWVYFNGLDNTTNYLVNLVTKEGAVITDHILSLDTQKDGYVELPYDTYDDVVLIIMNAGNTSTTNPSWVVSIHADGSVWLDKDYYSAPDVANVTVLDSGFDLDPNNPDTTIVEFTSDPTADTEDVILNETGDSTGIFTGSINLVVGDAVVGDSILQVHHNDTITVTYENADHDTVTDTALIYLISTPTGLTATAGRNYVFLYWNIVQSPALAGYNLYRNTSSSPSTATKVNGELITANSYQDIYLSLNTTYYYWVTAKSIYSYETDYSNMVEATTTTGGGPVCGNGVCESGENETSCPADCHAGGPVCGNGTCESGEDATSCPSDCGTTPSGGGGAGGKLSGCFIATACYGTPMAREVRALSNFRDEYLMTNSLGRFFVGTYYKVSPEIASFISEHPSLKNIVRWCLKPVVKLTERFR